MIGKKSFARRRPSRLGARSRRIAIGAAVPGAALTLPTYAFTYAGSSPNLRPSDAAAGSRASATQLVIDTQYDQRTADPARDASISGRYILGSVYDTLTSFKARKVNGRLSVSLSQPVPWLAQSYKSNKAGNVWTFVLRKGVQFSNGHPLTAKDVVFSLLRVKNVNSAPAFVTNSFASVTAVGQYTVRIVTKQPNPAIPYLMAYKSTGVVDSTVAQQNGASDAADASTTDKAQTYFDTHSIGSGPYIFQTFSNSGDSVLVRNPKFWGPKPYYDRIV